MLVTTLLENTHTALRPDLDAAHGLSLHILWGEQRMLFDLGPGREFADNAPELGVDLARVKRVVLSHHHYDHGGGLAAFLAANATAPIYLRAGIGEALYAKVLFKRRYAGLDRDLLARAAGRFVWISAPTEIAPDAFILTQIGRQHPAPAANRYLFIEQNGSLVPDDFQHELILVIREAGALVVFTGCSHSGILNMLDAVVQRFPGERIRAVFGGFHLMSPPVLPQILDRDPRPVKDLAECLLAYPVDIFYTGHCTSDRAYKTLKEVMGPRVAHMATGGAVEI
jgi:7,8-dihydropterin-6-yl-methyl-4-(beta-D-ribofuranosyl)aminobenzene 5'-phosphate synthase